MTRSRLPLVVALFLALGVSAQEAENGEAPPPPPRPEIPEWARSPRAVWNEFERRVRHYASAEVESALLAAGELFDFGDLSGADVERPRKQAARDLHAVKDRKAIYGTDISDDPEEPSPYTHVVRAGDKVLELVFVHDSVRGWRFARKLADELSQFVGQIQDLRGGLQFALPPPPGRETLVRDLMPVAWRQKGFLIDNWQWAGLFSLILFGLILELVVSWLFTLLIAALLNRRQHIDLKKNGRSPGRPVGRLAMATVWLFGVPYLLLPSIAHVLLMAAARLVMCFCVVWAVWRLVDVVAAAMLEKARQTESRLDDQIVPLVRRALKIFVGIAGFLWVAATLDWNIRGLLAGLGLGGLAFALAAKDTVANLFGSLTILMDRPFQIGDWIVTGDIEGTVELVGFRSCRVRTFYNSVITLPNSMLITAAVDNMGARRYRRVKETIGVTYDTPPEKVEALIEGIRELIRCHPYTRKDYYHVYLVRFGASSLDILLYAFLECPDWATELREKQRLLMDVFRMAHELGVEFAFPTQSLHVLQGEVPDHGAGPPDPDAARARGRDLARDLVDRYTGAGKPPPVVIRRKTGEDDAGDDAGDG